MHEGILYCTSYFRALEVADFLRINLEEIRINLIKILDNLVNVTTVRLGIFAFSAYNNPGQTPLERSKLDLMDRLAIDDEYKENPDRISELLEAKAAHTTVVDLSGLKAMQEWLSPTRKANWPKGFTNIPAIMSELSVALKLGTRLAELRHSNSHHPAIEEKAKEFSESIQKLAAEFRR
jgi:hypothetical protein